MTLSPFNFIKLILYVKIDIKYEIRIDQSTKFQFNPSKNRKVGEKLSSIAYGGTGAFLSICGFTPLKSKNR